MKMVGLLERPELPSPQDAQLATEASRTISKFKDESGELRVQLEDGSVLRLPKAARDLLVHLLVEMGQGNAVTLIPVHAELTTQEAADYMNVSRPYLISLLKSEAIRFRMVGTHRRIRFSDLEAYRKKVESERQQAMENLADQAQRSGFGY